MGRWFAVTAFFDADTDRFKWWYVDFERPSTRTAFGLDTRDLFLDAVVQPDLSIVWKDQDEYDQAIGLGLVSSEEQDNVAAAREEVVQLATGRSLLRGDWETWRRDRSWDMPVLPAEIVADVADLSPTA